MTKIERNDIAETIHTILIDDCNEIRTNYHDLHGNLNGLRKYVHQEVIEFWTNYEPYLDKEYLDMCTITIDNRIVNLDGIWCFIRDNM